MLMFEDEEELEEWLEGLDYEAFWKAIVAMPYVSIEERYAFDAQIARGVATEDEVLDGLKAFAQIVIAQAQDLLPRFIDPPGPSMRIH